MSLIRAPLVLLHAVLYQVASTPPNKSPTIGRYDTSESPLIKIAPLIFKIQQPLVWLCTIADILLVLSQHLPRSALSTALPTVLCPTSTSPASLIRPTNSFLIGLALVTAGTALRVACYRTLGPFFTFDLALLPKHKLIISGPYSFVRHPAYAGSLLVLAGIGLADLSPGGWVAECMSSTSRRGSQNWGSLSGGSMAYAWAGFAIWYGWWLAVGVRRARMEDAALRKEFGKEWDEYANQVAWWFFPGIL
ncbi:hypothetical protein BD309DRAFT_372972 [Dichomitus squalens]|uniref:Protein-S-isoprenylcysteine O-methyltransferase n=1 Tax=Dichomitus squalens TaxID=114155 RepID=A0A4Q9MAL5_9APHY|nr:hypothetical protein BD311DRAFT_868922 [Dichomitus squalens]TBU40059.1 hypothetical protein BD309DRAFT_372972 [Dichomitus squalens]TBU52745.1 hypothetical protein BD310DRAFT_205521 [Dichomitus squalens]